MLYHVVRFGYLDVLDDQGKAALLEQLRRLSDIPEVEEVVVGPDLGVAEDGFDVGVVVKMRDVDAYERYRIDPLHADIIAYVVPRWRKVMSINISDDWAPDQRARVQAMFARDEGLSRVGSLAS